MCAGDGGVEGVLSNGTVWRPELASRKGQELSGCWHQFGVLTATEM